MTTLETHSLRPSDPRLGRHVHHDSRSTRYAVGVLPKGEIKTRFWERRAPIWDQGALGSCTGHATAGLLATDGANWAGRTAVMVKAAGDIRAGTYPVDKTLAEAIYGLNTELDPFPGEWPPEDTGSSGLACAKSLQALGLCDVYQHAFSLEATQAAIQNGPALLGTIWLNSMFDTKADGRVIVNQRSGVAGGHELLISGYEVPTGGTTRGPGRWWLTNSWGTSWGKDGHGWVTDGELRWLLGQQGDVTVPNLVAADPEPEPEPEVPDTADQALWGAIQVWAETKGFLLPVSFGQELRVNLPEDPDWRAHR